MATEPTSFSELFTTQGISTVVAGIGIAIGIIWKYFATQKSSPAPAVHTVSTVASPEEDDTRIRHVEMLMAISKIGNETDRSRHYEIMDGMGDVKREMVEIRHRLDLIEARAGFNRSGPSCRIEDKP